MVSGESLMDAEFKESSVQCVCLNSDSVNSKQLSTAKKSTFVSLQ